jgi:hypothetical protein
MVGLLGGQHMGLRLGPHPYQHEASQAAPCTAPQLCLPCGCGNVVLLAPVDPWAISFGPDDQEDCLLPGHQVGPGRPSQLYGIRFVWWPRLSEDTGAGRLIPSVVV